MDDAMKKTLSIVVPCRNEERRLAGRRRVFSGFLKEAGRLSGTKAEMVIEEDGSTDRTPEIIDSFSKQDPCIKAVHCRKGLGKGGGMALGVEKSSGEFVVMCDADLPFSPRDVARMANLLEKNDLVIPNRRHPESKNVKVPFLRLLFSRVFGAYVNLLLGLGISDTQAGAKAFRREAFEVIRPRRFLSYSMDVEMLFRAKRAGLRIAEVPAEHRHGKDERFNWLFDGPRMLLDILEMRLSLSSF